MINVIKSNVLDINKRPPVRSVRTAWQMRHGRALAHLQGVQLRDAFESFVIFLDFWQMWCWF